MSMEISPPRILFWFGDGDLAHKHYRPRNREHPIGLLIHEIPPGPVGRTLTQEELQVLEKHPTASQVAFLFKSRESLKIATQWFQNLLSLWPEEELEEKTEGE